MVMNNKSAYQWYKTKIDPVYFKMKMMESIDENIIETIQSDDLEFYLMIRQDMNEMNVQFNNMRTEKIIFENACYFEARDIIKYLSNNNPNHISIFNDDGYLIYFKIITFIDKIKQLRTPDKLSKLFSIGQNSIVRTAVCPICQDEPEEGIKVLLCRMSHHIYCFQCIENAWKLNDIMGCIICFKNPSNLKEITLYC